MKTTFSNLWISSLFIVLSITAKSQPVEDFRKVYIDASVKDFPQASVVDSSFNLVAHGRPGELLINGSWLGKEQIADFIATIINSLGY